jgi:hypothetical protein
MCTENLIARVSFHGLSFRPEMASRASAAKRGHPGNVVEEEPLPESGHGTFVTSSGARYDGDWKRFDGVIKRHGRGEFATDEFTYDGDFQDDRFHGRGTLRWAASNSYSGDFAWGAINGEGEMLFLDGSKYRGQWRNGRMHGIGTFTTVNDQRWTGQWCHGMSTCPIFPQVLPPPPQEEEEELQQEEYE